MPSPAWPACRYEATINQLRTDIRIARGDIESAKRDAEVSWKTEVHASQHRLAQGGSLAANFVSASCIECTVPAN